MKAEYPDAGGDRDRTEFQQRLDEALDARTAPERDPWIAEQARRDPECRELLAAYLAMLDGLARNGRPRPSADLADRVLAELNAAPQTNALSEEVPETISFAGFTPLAAVRTVATWAAMAAAVSLVAFGVWRMNQHPVPAPGPGPGTEIADGDRPVKQLPDTQPDLNVAASNPDDGAAADPERPLPLDQLAAEFRSRSWLLAEETQESFSEVAVLLPTINRTGSTPGTGAEAADRPLMEQFRDGLSPVTTGVGPALDYLWNALPETGEGPTS